MFLHISYSSSYTLLCLFASQSLLSKHSDIFIDTSLTSHKIVISICQTCLPPTQNADLVEQEIFDANHPSRRVLLLLSFPSLLQHLPSQLALEEQQTTAVIAHAEPQPSSPPRHHQPTAVLEVLETATLLTQASQLFQLQLQGESVRQRPESRLAKVPPSSRHCLRLAVVTIAQAQAFGRSWEA